jgi:hypothetical protein
MLLLLLLLLLRGRRRRRRRKLWPATLFTKVAGGKGAELTTDFSHDLKIQPSLRFSPLGVNITVQICDSFGSPSPTVLL